MSLISVMRSSTSGMLAQSNLLSSVSDNIANVDTIGYKRSITDFSSMIDQSSVGESGSGGVISSTSYNILQQGSIATTSSPTDLAIKGNGFFLVSDANGQQLLTRSGSFNTNSQGFLVNPSGYKLLGLDLTNNTIMPTNSSQSLVPININNQRLQSNPTTSGVFTVNLSSNAPIIDSQNQISQTTFNPSYTSKSSISVYDNLGNSKNIDLYFTKNADNIWTIDAYDSSLNNSSGLPTSITPLAEVNLSFDPTNGQLASGSMKNLTIPIPGGKSLVLDLSNTTQLGSAFSVLKSSVNGNAAGSVTSVQISKDGQVSFILGNGDSINAYQICLGNVPSPQNLSPVFGDAYQSTIESGTLTVSNPNTGSMGSIVSSSLEQSTVDLATELTDMITAQRGYTANSKVFQTSADLLEVLENLK
jgi:flagellar hook protein FlgE